MQSLITTLCAIAPLVQIASASPHPALPTAIPTTEDYTKGLTFKYQSAGAKQCTQAKNDRPSKVDVTPEPKVTRPETGLNYGYSEFDPNKELACDFRFFRGITNAPDCKPAEPIPFPDVSGGGSTTSKTDCLYLHTPDDYKKALADEKGKAITKSSCVIVENFVFDADLSLAFELPDDSFLGFRGLIVGRPAGAPQGDPLISFKKGKGSKIAGDHAIIYIPGTANFDSKIKQHTPPVFKVSDTSGLTINGISILQADGPLWSIHANDTTLADVNVVVASPYPSNDRAADGFQLRGDNIKITQSFIQSGGDLIGLRSTTKAEFSCLSTFYGHALAIGAMLDGEIVKNVIFKDIQSTGAERTMRIKANKYTTGLVQDVQYSNIQFFESNFTGIALQQDFMSVPGPDGKPDTGVQFKGISFENIKGTVKQRVAETDVPTTTYTITCSAGPKTKGGCEDITFKDVSITGADGKDYPAQFVNFDATKAGITLKPEDVKKSSTTFDATGTITAPEPGESAKPNANLKPASKPKPSSVPKPTPVVGDEKEQ